MQSYIVDILRCSQCLLAKLYKPDCVFCSLLGCNQSPAPMVDWSLILQPHAAQLFHLLSCRDSVESRQVSVPTLTALDVPAYMQSYKQPHFSMHQPQQEDCRKILLSRMTSSLPSLPAAILDPIVSSFISCVLSFILFEPSLTQFFTYLDPVQSSIHSFWCHLSLVFTKCLTQLQSTPRRER